MVNSLKWVLYCFQIRFLILFVTAVNKRNLVRSLRRSLCFLNEPHSPKNGAIRHQFIIWFVPLHPIMALANKLQSHRNSKNVLHSLRSNLTPSKKHITENPFRSEKLSWGDVGWHTKCSADRQLHSRLYLHLQAQGFFNPFPRYDPLLISLCVVCDCLSLLGGKRVSKSRVINLSMEENGTEGTKIAICN